MVKGVVMYARTVQQYCDTLKKYERVEVGKNISSRYVPLAGLPFHLWQ